MNRELPPYCRVHRDVPPAPEGQKDIKKQGDAKGYPEPQILPYYQVKFGLDKECENLRTC
jgi:hypothetical protein